MKGMKFRATLIAIAVIAVMVLVSKFVYKEDFKRQEVYCDPTEPTYKYYENTAFVSAPSEISTEFSVK